MHKLYQAQSVGIVAAHAAAVAPTRASQQVSQPLAPTNEVQPESGVSSVTSDHVPKQQLPSSTAAAFIAPKGEARRNEPVSDNGHPPRHVFLGASEVALPLAVVAADAWAAAVSTLECALWTDELRHWQARRCALESQLLRHGLQHPPASVSALAAAGTHAHQGEALSRRAASCAASSVPAPPATDTTSSNAAFPDLGAEWCSLTCSVEDSSDIARLRGAVQAQIHELARALAAASSPAAAAGGGVGLVEPAHVTPVACAANVAAAAAAMCAAGAAASAEAAAGVQAELVAVQRQWRATLREVVHQEVRCSNLGVAGGRGCAVCN
jgi:hypothetical protein